MGFPHTRHTLIARLASGGSDDDWQAFLADYWGPICRFALRRGARNVHGAEEVAAETFEVLLRNKLLVRWSSHQSAKLRTLLCAVVRNILSNRGRARANRTQLVEDPADGFADVASKGADQDDVFYAAWAEAMLQRAVDALAVAYHRSGKSDYIRVLYGRLCQRMTIAQVAESLELKPSAVDNYFRHARQQLSKMLEQHLRRHVERYCSPEDRDNEFTVEWQRMGSYLNAQGGLDSAVQRAYDLLDSTKLSGRKLTRLTTTLVRIAAKAPPTSAAEAGAESA